MSTMTFYVEYPDTPEDDGVVLVDPELIQSTQELVILNESINKDLPSEELLIIASEILEASRKTLFAGGRVSHGTLRLYTETLRAGVAALSVSKNAAHIAGHTQQLQKRINYLTARL